MAARAKGGSASLNQNRVSMYGMNPEHPGLIEATAKRFWGRLFKVAPDYYGQDDFHCDLALIYAKTKNEFQDDNDIARAFVTRADQFSKNKVGEFLNEMVMEPEGRKEIEIPKLEFLRLAKTKTNKQLAEKYGCTTRTIINKKRKWGILQ